MLFNKDITVQLLQDEIWPFFYYVKGHRSSESECIVNLGDFKWVVYRCCHFYGANTGRV